MGGLGGPRESRGGTWEPGGCASFPAIYPQGWVRLEPSPECTDFSRVSVCTDSFRPTISLNRLFSETHWSDSVFSWAPLPQPPPSTLQRKPPPHRHMMCCPTLCKTLGHPTQAPSGISVSTNLPLIKTPQLPPPYRLCFTSKLCPLYLHDLSRIQLHPLPYSGPTISFAWTNAVFNLVP